MKRDHEEIVSFRDVRNRAASASNLLDAGQKHEDVAVVPRRGLDRPNDGRFHPFGERRFRVRINIFHLDGERPSGHANDRAIAQEGRDRPCVKGGRHDDDNQVVADRVGHFFDEGDRHVAVQASLVELVQDHRTDAFQERVGDDLVREDALGDDPQDRLGRGLPLAPNLITDLLAERPPALVGDATSGSARRHSSRLEHHDGAICPRKKAGCRQRGGNPRRFARAWRRDEHEPASVADEGQDLVDVRVDREGLHAAIDTDLGEARQGTPAKAQKSPRFGLTVRLECLSYPSDARDDGPR